VGVSANGTRGNRPIRSRISALVSGFDIWSTGEMDMVLLPTRVMRNKPVSRQLRYPGSGGVVCLFY
jgi:hypothetical protein